MPYATYKKNYCHDIIDIVIFMLKEYRLKRKYTLEQLAELCGISWRNLFRIENGNYKNTKFETIAKLLIILEFSNEDIIKFIKNVDNKYPTVDDIKSYLNKKNNT